MAIRRWRKAWFSAPIKAERKAFREALQAENYDAVIDAQGLVKSAALVTRLAHGVKHGLDWQTAREPLASLFYNRKHHIAKQQHAVERTRELFAKSLAIANANPGRLCYCTAFPDEPPYRCWRICRISSCDDP
ncbi:lipopolysaccharide heptosyltransferase 1 [Escherichia coli]|uniref:Lipopolysaccharide heptosyltransferase 1 n=1 Tax=Escherichia coli TaxID=562 RepID=A0A377BTP2_ECOLX|nr:lipopolysaccharide heptosyltransferase 1 [Escherichia coli]